MTQAFAYRIIDANFNRAREALRVLEDYARFACNDGPAARRIRSARHELSQAVARLEGAKLLEARDIGADVGARQPSPSDEMKRDPKAVATAAAKRLPEALRAIEEYSRAVNSSLADLACRLRYESYDLEKRLLSGQPRLAQWRQVRLYLLLTSGMCKGDPVKLADDLLAAGVDCIQLREKTLPDRRLLALAGQLRQVCAARSAMLIVNDRPDIAALVDADGVHVGQDDLHVHQVRRLSRRPVIVGVSTHNMQQVRQAMQDGADYVALGPAFATDTKPAEPTAGLQFVTEALNLLAESDIPHVAIGGVTPENLPQLMDRGVRCVAVCSAVLAADDPPAAARQLAKMLKSAAR